MHDYEKEVIQSQLNREKEVLKSLKDNYQDALNEIDNKIAILLGRDDATAQHVVYQIEFQKSLKKQVEGVLETLHSNEFETISEYLTKSYDEGFLGTMYSLHKQDVPLIFPIDQEQIVQAIQHETNLSEDLYTSLGKDIKRLNKQIAGEISRGIATAQTYNEIARNIAGYTKIGLNNSMRIARTEAHRIQTKASMDACTKAKSKGADIVKQWDSMLDAKTRTSHAHVDGEIRELEEKFSNGLLYPSDPKGKAEEVINCRCALLQRARWNLGSDFTKWDSKAPVVISDSDATQYSIIQAKNFEEFQKKYKQASERVREDVQKINEQKSTPESFAEISKKYKIVTGNRGKEKLYPREEKAITDAVNFIQSEFGDISDIVATIKAKKSLGGSNVSGLYDRRGEYYKIPNAVYVNYLANDSTIVHEMVHAVSSEIAEHFNDFGFKSRNEFMDAMEKEAYSMMGMEVPKHTNDLLHYERRNSSEYFSVILEGDYEDAKKGKHDESTALQVLKKYWMQIRK